MSLYGTYFGVVIRDINARLPILLQKEQQLLELIGPIQEEIRALRLIRDSVDTCKQWCRNIEKMENQLVAQAAARCPGPEPSPEPDNGQVLEIEPEEPKTGD